MSGAAEDVTVVWVAPEAGRDDATRAVLEWARARGLRVRTARESSHGALERVDFTIADRVEKELDRAREATAALDADVAERALARAETLLREHPELPQGAWLRAEVHRSWAARWTRIEPRDDRRAQSAWQEAEALDGGRAAGIGEVAFPTPARAPATLRVEGASAQRLVARLDGVSLTAAASQDGATTYALDVAAAEHQIVVSVDGETVFASWVAISAAAGSSGPPVVSVRVGDDGACSTSSFGGVSADGAGGVRATGVTCESWVAAMPAERPGAVLVARCERAACGPFLEWRTGGGLDAAPGPAPPPHVRRGGAWPVWATWTALGVGAVAATTITLIATGVFESRPTEQRFVGGGVRVE